MPQAPPAYLRVAARIRERIGTRELPTGTRLPTENQLKVWLQVV